MPRVMAVVLSAALALSAAAASAHEFWIDPVPRLPASGPVSTDLRVGQFFIGDIYPYISSKFNFLQITNGDKTTDIKGNEGDLPAVSIDTVKPGLNIISFYGKPNRVTFNDTEKFLVYITTEGLRWVLKRHRERGLPMKGFTEVFSRTVKSLVQVGPVRPDDHDVKVGMPFELVAGANPYAFPDVKKMPVTLYWQGEPLPDWQISIFRKVSPDQLQADRTDVRTDENGQATIDLTKGGRFLINAVHMREAAPSLDAAWESHWASLTFSLKLQ